MLNTDNNKITEMSSYLVGIGEIQCTCSVGNHVCILPQNANELCGYDLSTKKVRAYKVKETVGNCVDAVFANGNIYWIIYK